MKDELMCMDYVPLKGGKRIITVKRKRPPSIFAKHPVGEKLGGLVLGVYFISTTLLLRIDSTAANVDLVTPMSCS